MWISWRFRIWSLPETANQVLVSERLIVNHWCGVLHLEASKLIQRQISQPKRHRLHVPRNQYQHEHYSTRVTRVWIKLQPLNLT